MTIQPYQEYHRQPEQPAHERWLQVYEPMIDLATRLANSPFVPDGMRGDQGGVFAVILAGHGLGLHPVAALQSISMIKGKPYLDTGVYLGLAYSAGHTVIWGDCTDKRATVRVTRGDGHGSAEVTYTMAQAQLAGLAGKDNWRRMPGEMLRARAVRAALKMVAPDLLLGIEPADDTLTDPVDNPRGNPVENVTVQLAPAPVPVEKLPETERKLEENSQETVEKPSENPPETGPETGQKPDLLTTAQMRKIGAQIGELERIDGRKLSREERREFIGTLAGIDQLGSAKDLTKDQASRVIEELTRVIGDAMDKQSVDTGDVDVP